MSFTDNRMLFKQESYKFSVTPLEGTYPDTESMITKEYNSKAVVSTKNLLRTLERSMIISDNGSGFIISMQINNQHIKIYCQSGNGYLDENIVLQSLDGDSFEIKYNVRYALDALKTIRTVYTAINYNLGQRMIIFKPHDGGNTLHLIMAAIKYKNMVCMNGHGT